MRILSSLAVTIAALTFAGCSRDSSAPTQTTPSYTNVAGSYNGQVLGSTQGVALASTLGFAIAQSGGDFSGTWTLSGTLFDGLVSSAATVTGTFTGTVTTGADPAVSLTIKVPACPAFQARFAGSYASATRQLTITGPIVIFANNNCSAGLTYQATVVLKH